MLINFLNICFPLSLIPVAFLNWHHVRHITWCCRGPSRPWRSAAACCRWWRRGSWLLSRWRRRGRASIWSPTWTGPSPGRSLGICCTPAEGHSTSAAGRCSPCNPVDMKSSFACFAVQPLKVMKACWWLSITHQYQYILIYRDPFDEVVKPTSSWLFEYTELQLSWNLYKLIDERATTSILKRSITYWFLCIFSSGWNETQNVYYKFEVFPL